MQRPTLLFALLPDVFDPLLGFVQLPPHSNMTVLPWRWTPKCVSADIMGAYRFNHLPGDFTNLTTGVGMDATWDPWMILQKWIGQKWNGIRTIQKYLEYCIHIQYWKTYLHPCEIAWYSSIKLCEHLRWHVGHVFKIKRPKVDLVDTVGMKGERGQKSCYGGHACIQYTLCILCASWFCNASQQPLHFLGFLIFSFHCSTRIDLYLSQVSEEWQ